MGNSVCSKIICITAVEVFHPIGFQTKRSNKIIWYKLILSVSRKVYDYKSDIKNTVIVFYYRNLYDHSILELLNICNVGIDPNADFYLR